MRITNVSCTTDADRNFPIQNTTLDISILLEMSEEEILRDVFNDSRNSKVLLNALVKMEARKYLDKKSLDSLDIIDLLKSRYPQNFI